MTALDGDYKYTYARIRSKFRNEVGIRPAFRDVGPR